MLNSPQVGLGWTQRAGVLSLVEPPWPQASLGRGPRHSRRDNRGTPMKPQANPPACRPALSDANGAEFRKRAAAIRERISRLLDRQG